ncbi:MAG: hypothetical protein ACWA44_02785 [Thiotrichales bacterium]
MSNQEQNLGKDLEELGEFVQGVGIFLSEIGKLTNPYFAAIERQRHEDQCKRVLRIKAFTLGLTYFERQRLRDVS